MTDPRQAAEAVAGGDPTMARAVMAALTGDVTGERRVLEQARAWADREPLLGDDDAYERGAVTIARNLLSHARALYEGRPVVRIQWLRPVQADGGRGWYLYAMRGIERVAGESREIQIPGARQPTRYEAMDAARAAGAAYADERGAVVS